MRIVKVKPREGVKQVDHTLVVEGQLQLAVRINRADFLACRSQNRKRRVVPGHETVNIVFVIDAVLVCVLADGARHLDELLQRPVAALHQRVGVVETVCRAHSLVKQDGVGGHVIDERNVARGVVHLVADHQILIGALIPIGLGQVDVLHRLLIVEVMDIAAVCKCCNIPGADGGGIVGVVARHMVAGNLHIALTAAVDTHKAENLIIGDIDVVLILEVGIAAVDGSVHRSSLFALGLEVIEGVVAGDKDSELARNIADFLRRRKIRRIRVLGLDRFLGRSGRPCGRLFIAAGGKHRQEHEDRKQQRDSFFHCLTLSLMWYVLLSIIKEPLRNCHSLRQSPSF